MTQPHLIQSILEDLNLTQAGATSRPIPALSTKLLGKDLHEPEFDNSFNYRRVIGKLLYLEKSSRPELAYAVHQCARFSNNPRRTHGEAVKRIGRYLLATADKGMQMKPNGSSFECWVDASHAAEWNKQTAIDDPATAKSRMGYVLFYAGCPIFWASKMQTEIALSSTEAEYIALSQSMREILPLMELMKEAHAMKVPIKPQCPKIHCTVFEDNSGAIEIAKVPKMRPRTKHLNIKYHHFRSFVQEGSISVQHVSTDEQIADIFTKPLNEDLFGHHRKKLVGW
jgi:histone deacetylase 1/2